MRLTDACDCLGIALGASREEAQRAYRKAALQFHPDRNPNDPSATSKFQTVGEAWERVQQYLDNPRRWGQHADPPEDFASNGGDTNSSNNHYAASWEEMFAQWFGGGGGGGGGGMPRYSYSDFEPPPAHKAGCKCSTCKAERRRESEAADRGAGEVAQAGGEVADDGGGPRGAQPVHVVPGRHLRVLLRVEIKNLAPHPRPLMLQMLSRQQPVLCI